MAGFKSTVLLIVVNAAAVTLDTSDHDSISITVGVVSGMLWLVYSNWTLRPGTQARRDVGAHAKVLACDFFRFLCSPLFKKAQSRIFEFLSSDCTTLCNLLHMSASLRAIGPSSDARFNRPATRMK